MEENKKKLFCLDKTIGQLSSLHYNDVHKNHLNWKINQVVKAILLPH